MRNFNDYMEDGEEELTGEEGKRIIIETVRDKIEKSGMLQYADKERFEQLFSNIHILDTQEQLQEKEGMFISSSEEIEGFSKDNHIFVGPNANPHTIIREIIRELSTKVDENGTVTTKGIIEDGSDGQKELNSGLIEYLATKVSGEESKYHLISQKVFKELEPLMVSHTKEPNILMRTLLKNSNYIHTFVNEFSKSQTASRILHGIHCTNNEQLESSIYEIKRSFNRYAAIESIKSKIKKVLFQSKRKALPLVKDTTHSQEEIETETKEKQWRESLVGAQKTGEPNMNNQTVAFLSTRSAGNGGKYQTHGSGALQSDIYQGEEH